MTLFYVKNAELEQDVLGENHGPGAPRLFDNGAREYFQKYGGGMEHLAQIGESSLPMAKLS